jgi:FkbM family methyltransferase
MGLARSLRVYRMDRAHARAMDGLYAQFVKPGDTVFDIGAHVGDRVASFRRLGARVVALEPQSGPAAVIRALHARDRKVLVLADACGEAPGTAQMRINSRNPTVSTLSSTFVDAASGASGWSDQVWDAVAEVRVTTLDALVAEYGEPSFIKIDVEGFEDRVVAGLTHPVRALSFEFTTLQRDVAHRAVARLRDLGPYRFNYAAGETQRLAWGEFGTADALDAFLDALPHEANSGDVYARLDT